MDTLQLNDDEISALQLQRRVFVVSSRSEPLVRQLSSRGLAVEVLTPRALLPAIAARRPDAIVLGDSLTEEPRSGRQLALSLRARGRTFSIPVVGVLPEVGVPTVFKWLEVGAVDVWSEASEQALAPRLQALISECEATNVHTGPSSARVLGFLKRNQLSGTARVYPDTPFEGVASFVDGQLVEASLGPLEGGEALEQMLELDAESISWTEATVVTQPMAAAAAPASLSRTSRVLVVEDIETIALLVRKTLTHAGYLVDLAADGREGLQAALKLPYDIIVADLNLPLLDGWGLMRALREDPVARESAVLVLSAHDELVDSLRAARAGARAWVKKSGRAKVLLDTMSLLGRPRAQAWSSLSRKLPTSVELRTVGPVWFLRALAELDCRGRLEAEDELSRVELEVCQGQLVNATAQVGSHRVQGERALEVLLRLRGHGRFEPSPVELPRGAPWVFDAVQRACDGLATESSQRLEELLRDPASLTLNPELAVLFANVATHRQLAVLDALSRRASSFGELVEEVGQTEDEVRRVLAELIRRAVLTREG